MTWMELAVATPVPYGHPDRRRGRAIPARWLLAACVLIIALSAGLGSAYGARALGATLPGDGSVAGVGVGSGASGPFRSTSKHAHKRKATRGAHARNRAKACLRRRRCHRPKPKQIPKRGAPGEGKGGSVTGASNASAVPGNPLQPQLGASLFPSEATPGPSSPSEPLRLFSAQSVFNEQLPGSPPLASNSAALVADFVHQVAKYQGHVVINTTEWSTPVYVVPADAPTVAMVGKSSTCPRPEGVFAGFQAQIEAVPLPAGAVPAAGTDKEVVVWQPSTRHLWELWQVVNEAGRWRACWGGEIPDALSSDGIFPAPFGAGASGLSLLGGQIHLEDLQRGTIDHALEILMPDTAASGYVWPADRTDGTSTASDAIPEGTRLRLSPSLNLSSLHLSRPALEIATAIQRYGMIVGDTAGSVALSAQDPTPLMREGGANPYDTLLPSPYDTLDSIPWNRLEVVSPGYQG